MKLTVHLGVSGIPERVESTGPRCDPSRKSQEDQDSETDGEHQDDKRSQQHLELSAGYHLPYNLDESDKLDQTKYTKRGHVFTCSNGKVLDERDLHRSDRAEDVP